MQIRPILFNTEMVRAILDGHKTVTRRVVKPQPGEELAYIFGGHNHGKWGYSPYNESRYEEHRQARDWKYWTPPCHGDDILWVRETFFYERHMENLDDEKPDLPSGRYSRRYVYRADSPDYPVTTGVYAGGWCPSIFMPREAARIFLRVTGVRVERLQDIDVDGCKKEGVYDSYTTLDEEICQSFEKTTYLRQNFEKIAYLDVFKELWNSTIKPADRDKYGWDANPFCWVIEFQRCEKPEGF